MTGTITKQLDEAKAFSMEHNSMVEQLMNPKFGPRPSDQHTVMTNPIQQPVVRKEQIMAMYEKGSQPMGASMMMAERQKEAHIRTVQLNSGSIADKVTSARDHYEEIPVGAVFAQNEMIDSKGVTSRGHTKKRLSRQTRRSTGGVMKTPWRMASWPRTMLSLSMTWPTSPSPPCRSS